MMVGLTDKLMEAFHLVSKDAMLANARKLAGATKEIREQAEEEEALYKLVLLFLGLAVKRSREADSDLFRRRKMMRQALKALAFGVLVLTVFVAGWCLLATRAHGSDVPLPFPPLPGDPYPGPDIPLPTDPVGPNLPR